MASVPPYKQALDKAVKWLSQEIEREGVEIRLNTGGDVNCIEEQRPDVVMLATGARPILPIAVSSHDILSAGEVLAGRETGKRVLSAPGKA